MVRLAAPASTSGMKLCGLGLCVPLAPGRERSRGLCLRQVFPEGMFLCFCCPLLVDRPRQVGPMFVDTLFILFCRKKVASARSTQGQKTHQMRQKSPVKLYQVKFTLNPINL